MTHFSINPDYVRGDLFNVDGGKWKYTVCIDMKGYYDHWNIVQAVYLAFKNTPSNIRGVTDATCNADYALVVLDPSHKYSHPVCIPNLRFYGQRIDKVTNDDEVGFVA